MVQAVIRVGAGWVRAMKQAVPYLGRFLSKFVFEIIPGALVSVLAAYFLSMLHLARGAEPAADPPALTTLQNDGLSADERRELTRQMLKERRENPEQPAEVKPIPSLRPTAPAAETADLAAPVAAPQVSAPQVAAPQVAAPQVIVPEPKPRSEPEAKPRPEAARPAVAAVTPVPPAPPLPRVAAPRARPEPAQSAAAAPAAPPVGAVTAAVPAAPGAPVAVPGAATPLPPVTVNTTPVDAAVEPPRRSFAGSVFSSFSSIAGGAANVTGNTVNWVIDLPGKAISAGGRLLGGSSPAPAPVSAPAAAPAPTGAPADPQRRNP
jgi:hypothetical protein